MSIQPFPMIEIAVKAAIESTYHPAEGKIGGDLSYEHGDDLYVFVGLVPGSGRTDETSGQWAVDIDVFAPTYASAMTHALAIEAALIPGRHVTSTIIIDNVYQNSAPAERPWRDDGAFRVGGTYVVTGRRSG